jgi:hypothetical protein
MFSETFKKSAGLKRVTGNGKSLVPGCFFAKDQKRDGLKRNIDIKKIKKIKNSIEI